MLTFVFKTVIVVVVLMVVVANLPPATDRAGARSVAAVPGLPLDEPEDVTPAGLVGVVNAAVSDAAGFCHRQPDACRNAGAAIADFGPRFVTLIETVAGTALGSQGHSVAPPAQNPAAVPGPAATLQPTGTLTADDATAAWSLPQRP